MSLRFLGAILTIQLLVCGSGFSQSVSQEHAREISKWRADREVKLSAGDGYLAITGLFRLKPGANSFGSGADNDFSLFGSTEASIPPRLGTFHRAGNEVVFEVDTSVRVVDGEENAVRGRVVMLDDSKGDQVTLLKSGSLSWVVIRRGVSAALSPERSPYLQKSFRESLGVELYVRVWDTEASLLKDHGDPKNFEMDSAWRFEAEFRAYDVLRPLFQHNVLGLVEESPSSGVVVFEYEGVEYELEVSDEGDNLFIVFADLTNDKETYGGGRFVDVQRPASGSKVVIDFNTSRNPWCLYSTFTTCAFPTAKNHLPFRVPAGEMLPDKTFH